MRATIDFFDFAEKVKLPEGFRFKQWAPGELIAIREHEGFTYYGELAFAIERTADNKFSESLISYLHGDGTSATKVNMFAEDLAKAVDTAIAELEG